MKLFISTLLILITYYLPLTTHRLFAYSYLGTSAIGDMVSGHGLRSSAMGGAGIAGSDEPSTLLHNPATMNFLEQKQVSVGFGFVPFTERVVTADRRTYYNETIYFSFENFAAVLPFKDGMFAAGIAYAPLFDRNYTHSQFLYSEETPATKTGYKELKTTGGISTISPAVSVKFGDLFSFGLSYNMISGSVSYLRREVNTTVTPNTEDKIESSASASGSSVNFGVILSVLKSVKLGLGYHGPAEIKLKSDSVKVKYNLPGCFGVGINWDFGGKNNTKLAFDYLPLPYSDVKIEDNKIGWSDISVVKIGVEHLVGEDMPLRFGYYSLPFYAKRQIELVSFTVGVGYKVSEKMYFDVMGEYGKRNFYGDNVFFGTKETVDESFKKLMFGAKYKW